VHRPGRYILDEGGAKNTTSRKTDFQLRGVTQMTKTRIALAAVVFAATSSAAFAQGYYDPNLANRYPSYADPNTYGYSSSGKLGSLQSASAGTLQSAPVRLKNDGKAHRQSQRVQQRDVALPIEGAEAPQIGPFWYSWSGPTTGGM
jgi:hypothetical protein